MSISRTSFLSVKIGPLTGLRLKIVPWSHRINTIYRSDVPPESRGDLSILRRGLGSLYTLPRGRFPQGNIRILAVASLLTGTYVSMLNATLQQFTLSLGLGVASLGLLQGLGNRIGGLSGSLVQPFAGRLADVYGRRVVLMGGSLVSISSM